MSDLKSLIKNLDVFNYLEEEDIKTVEGYLFPYSYQAGNYVFKEGTHGGYMLFIANGEVEVIKQFDDKRATIATLGKGASMGEMSLIDSAKRSATVKACTDLDLIVLKREDFQKLLDEHPKCANKILMGITKLLSRSLRQTTQEFTNTMLSLA